jgi:hypothetical protein
VSFKRWEVTRYVLGGRPYRVHVPPAELELLEVRCLGFCREARTAVEVEGLLAQGTDCPQERVHALQMTLTAGLFLGARTGRRGRLLEAAHEQGAPLMFQTTALGLEWLESMDVKKENQDAE